MIGLIVTGHGKFATSLQSALELIAGAKEEIEFVDFDCDSVTELDTRLKAAVDRLEKTDSILALCDLTGGSPFKTMAMISNTLDKKVEIIGGVNLPILIELTLARQFIEDLEQLTTMGIQTGKDNIIRFELPKPTIREDDGDGI